MTFGKRVRTHSIADITIDRYSADTFSSRKSHEHPLAERFSSKVSLPRRSPSGPPRSPEISVILFSNSTRMRAFDTGSMQYSSIR